MSAFLLVVGAALLMLIWATAQQGVNLNVRRRVRIAEASRVALIRATTAVEEGVEIFATLVNEPESVEETPPDESLAAQLRSIEPGTVLNFAFRPARAEMPHEGAPVWLSQVEGTAYLTGATDEIGEMPSDFSCEKYERYLVKWSKVPS